MPATYLVNEMLVFMSHDLSGPIRGQYYLTALSVTELLERSRLTRAGSHRLMARQSWSVATWDTLRRVRPGSPGMAEQRVRVRWRQLVISPYWARQYHSRLLRGEEAHYGYSFKCYWESLPTFALFSLITQSYGGE